MRPDLFMQTKRSDKENCLQQAFDLHCYKEMVDALVDVQPITDDVGLFFDSSYMKPLVTPAEKPSKPEFVFSVIPEDLDTVTSFLNRNRVSYAVSETHHMFGHSGF